MLFPQRVRLLFGSSKFGDEISSFADPGCLSRILDARSRIRIFSILDPGSWIKIFCILDPWSRIRIFSIPDPGSRMRIKEFKYFNKKNGFSALRNMIRVCDPGSGAWISILTFYLSQIPILDLRYRIQGSKRHRIPDTGSPIPICNIGDFEFAQAVGGSVGYWLSTGAAVLKTHSMDQVSEAFMCIKEFSVYFILTLSL